jgi:hypothetical protein
VTEPFRRTIGTSINPLRGLEEVLFIQARVTDQRNVSGVVSTVQIGAVFTLATRRGHIVSKRADVADAVARHKTTVGTDAGVLLDGSPTRGRAASAAPTGLTRTSSTSRSANWAFPGR